MLAGRAGEIVSERETPSQCGRVGSPDFTQAMFVLIRFTLHHTVILQHFTSYSVSRNFMSILFLSNNAGIVLTGRGSVMNLHFTD